MTWGRPWSVPAGAEGAVAQGLLHLAVKISQLPRPLVAAMFGGMVGGIGRVKAQLMQLTVFTALEVGHKILQ